MGKHPRRKWRFLAGKFIRDFHGFSIAVFNHWRVRGGYMVSGRLKKWHYFIGSQRAKPGTRESSHFAKGNVRIKTHMWNGPTKTVAHSLNEQKCGFKMIQTYAWINHNNSPATWNRGMVTLQFLLVQKHSNLQWVLLVWLPSGNQTW